MKNKVIKFIPIMLLLILSACVSVKQPKIESEVSLYRKAIVNSMVPDSSKIYSNLVQINDKNTKLIRKEIDGQEYILMVSLKQKVSYYKPYLDSTFYNTGSYPIWVTAAPELASRMKAEKSGDVSHRLNQLLGLPPGSVYCYFVEFWVKPEDLFRPCPDKEINDNKCDLCFPDNKDNEHITWINQNRIDRYYQCDINYNYPWTQLGYTYDWNPQNPSHVGLSEFVIGKGKNIKIAGIYTIKEYLNNE